MLPLAARIAKPRLLASSAVMIDTHAPVSRRCLPDFPFQHQRNGKVIASIVRECRHAPSTVPLVGQTLEHFEIVRASRRATLLGTRVPILRGSGCADVLQSGGKA